MSNYSSGHQAEQVAAEHLRSVDYEIVALNWRNKRAEIDIIARKRKRWGKPQPLVFFEVKHRKTDQQGRGLDYITPAKLRQMQFAAEFYVAVTGYSGDYTLGAVEMSGPDYTVSNVLDIL